jgi:D-alanyl-D-alanine carboxypeptidase (penicillin-binding protein 5/6)
VAPLKKGDVLGKLTVTYNEQKYEVNLVAKEDVKKAGWFKLFTRSIRNFFKNLF